MGVEDSSGERAREIVNCSVLVASLVRYSAGYKEGGSSFPLPLPVLKGECMNLICCLCDHEVKVTPGIIFDLRCPQCSSSSVKLEDDKKKVIRLDCVTCKGEKYKVKSGEEFVSRHSQCGKSFFIIK